jgi:hypothetical protein
MTHLRTRATLGKSPVDLSATTRSAVGSASCRVLDSAPVLGPGPFHGDVKLR